MANEILYTEALAQDINFVTRFENDLHNLLAVLGKSDVQVVAPGTAFKIYPTSGVLDATTVLEKGLIPDSGISVGNASVVELTYKKYRNLTGIESIGKYGYELAVGETNKAMLKLIQAGIRASIFTALATGTGTAVASGFQKQVAAAAAGVAKKFEDEAYTPVFFANPDDAYGYLGEHNITLETQFGLSYLANFMGIGNVIVDSNVPSGTVIGTACENLAVVAASIGAIPGMEMTTDESGIIAVHNGARYENAAIETVAYSGLAVKPVFLDRIIKASAGQSL
ncbi:MAG: hypothetical protein IJJ44_03385 [Solobacterium sp.]|nr:hypothetical protein [Solobacterium sp.]